MTQARDHEARDHEERDGEATGREGHGRDRKAPAVATLVHYTLNAEDADAINARREDADAFRRESRVAGGSPAPEHGGQVRYGHVAHAGNAAREGDVCAAMVVAAFAPSATTVNLQVHLDGNDTFWATSRAEGEGPGHWQPLPRA
jgi:hypothetical protein